MPLWAAIALGTVLWAPVVFGLAVLVGKFIHDGTAEAEEQPCKN